MQQLDGNMGLRGPSSIRMRKYGLYNARDGLGAWFDANSLGIVCFTHILLSGAIAKVPWHAVVASSTTLTAGPATAGIKHSAKSSCMWVVHVVIAIGCDETTR